MTSILADATEAVIGAVFLDSSFATAQRLTQEWLAVRMTTLGTSEERSVGWLDPRGLLQHITQKQFGAPPNYDLIHTKGPDHAPLFTVSATIKGRTLGTGVGPTKRAASRAAAENALDQGDEE